MNLLFGILDVTHLKVDVSELKSEHLVPLETRKTHPLCLPASTGCVLGTVSPSHLHSLQGHRQWYKQ